MEVLRVPPYNAISIDFVVPSGYNTPTDFVIIITDMADLSFTETTASAVSGDTLQFVLSGKYDNDYNVVVKTGTTRIHEDTYEVRRPYSNPNDHGTTASEITKYAEHEQLARAIIDSVIEEGFYYKKKNIQMAGLGSDYLPLWDDVKNIVEVYENNVLVTDRVFEITPDGTALQQQYVGALNRLEGAPNTLPQAPSDIIDFKFGFLGFPKTFDYTIVAEIGHVNVPADIKKATELLIHDIDCGKLDYYKRYVSSYITDQFRIQFDKGIFEGTGNILVDKILSKYLKSIKKFGVL